MHSRLPSTLRRLLHFAGFLLTLGAGQAQSPFEARFETDAQGTWLVYPSSPGWHYTVQYSTDLTLDPNTDELAFTNEPDGYGYGIGSDLRFFIAPPQPPANSGPPPEKPVRDFYATLYVCFTPNDSRVQVKGTGTDSSLWSILAPGILPRDGGTLTITTETATDFHRLHLIVFMMPATRALFG